MTIEKRVAIIGAGAAGLAALRVFTTFQRPGITWKVTAFEAREDVGGIWLPAPPEGDPPATPLYDSLTTNLPHPLMAFHHFPFPPSTRLFPHSSAVLDYLRYYTRAFGLWPFIQLRTRVDRVQWDKEHNRWTITLHNGVSETFDHVIICNGHFSRPYIPTFPGLDKWKAVEGREVSHSMWYREPSSFRQRSLLIIGGGPSGDDMASDASGVAKVVYQSIAKPELKDPREGVVLKGPVSRFEAEGRVIFQDGSEEFVDRVVLATGYTHWCPFLRDHMQEVPPPPTFTLPPELINSGGYLPYPLAEDLITLPSTYSSSLAFIGLFTRLSPFPLMEVQALAVARIFADPSSLNEIPVLDRLRAKYDRLSDETEDNPELIAKKWLRLRDELDEQFTIRAELLQFAGVQGWEPQDWMKRTFMNKWVLRDRWRKIEREGKAEEWVFRLDKGGYKAWIEFMDRLAEDEEVDPNYLVLD